MADRGFSMKDMLKELDIELNLPPFLQGQEQLPPEEVQKGRKIASLRIHVERERLAALKLSILKQIIPISMARLTYQSKCLCLFVQFSPRSCSTSSIMRR